MCVFGLAGRWGRGGDVKGGCGYVRFSLGATGDHHGVYGSLGVISDHG